MLRLMFEFLTRRHAAPAETPLSEVRFTREDLFVLLGGCDTSMLANGEYTIDFDQLERRGTDPWRRDMAARLSPTGLVDAEGTPSDELAEALYPLNKPGMVVDDGGTPQSARERDEGTVSAVLFEGSASAIRRLPGRRAGFSVVPLGAEADWDVSFRGFVGCPPLASPWEGQVVLTPPDPEVGSAIRRGDELYLRGLCAKCGGDAEALSSFAGKLSSNSSVARGERAFVVADYRDCRFEESLGFIIPQTNSPSYWAKSACVFPAEGVVLNAMRLLRDPESDEIIEYGAIYFNGGGTLLDALTRFQEPPSFIR